MVGAYIHIYGIENGSAERLFILCFHYKDHGLLDTNKIELHAHLIKGKSINVKHKKNYGKYE